MSNNSRTHQFGVQSLEEFLNTDTPFLSWEELQQKLLLPPQDRPSMRESTPSNSIESLLSESSYLMPESPIPQDDQRQEAPLYGGFFIETPSSQDELDQRIQSTSTPEHRHLRHRSELSTSSLSPRKRGRPRKDAADVLDEDPEERRRLQIRLAQRAYRSRRERSLTRYKDRIAQLENAVENMSTSVLSLSQRLVQSGALESNLELATHLHGTVLTCLRSVNEAGCERETPDAFPASEESPSTPSREAEINPVQPWMVELIARSQLNASQPSAANHVRSQDASIGNSPCISGSTEVTDIELPAFMERLHTACVSQGYMALHDRSITTDRLRRPFRLLLTFMSRERLTSYFEAALQCRLSQRRLDEWKDVPFFSLGGAGTHALPGSSSGRLSLPQQWVTVQDPLAQFPPEIQEDLDGEWFTIHDLEMFLRQKGVNRFACDPAESRPSSPTRTVVSVARLIHALISKCICLGRSPGFRRCDVERALSAAVSGRDSDFRFYTS